MTRLISALELGEEADFAVDYFGVDWKADPKTRRIVDALVDAEAAIRAFEDAARQRANPAAAMAAALICPPALDDSRRLDERARKAGAA